MRRPQALIVLLACALAAEGVVVKRAAAQPTSRIAFTTGRGAEIFEIWSMAVDGTDQRVLIRGPAASIEADPSWAPNGSDLAFARKAPNDETYDVFVRLGGHAVRITDEGGGVVANDRQPDWSPSGAQIAFTRARLGLNTSNIHVIRPDGSGLTRLTETAAGAFDASPTWSPEGTQIAFVSDRTGFPQLYTMDAGGAVESQRTFGSCFVANPSWAPAGVPNLIAYEQLCPGSPSGWDIHTFDVSTGVAAAVTATAEHDHQPTWSPDGTELAFTRYPAGGGDKNVHTIDLSTLAVSPALTTDPAADLAPDWSSGAGMRLTGTSAAAPTPVASTGGGSTRMDAASTGSVVEARAPRKKRKKRRRRKRFKVMNGVRYLQLRRFRSDVYVLKVTPTLAPTVDVALSNDLLSGHERVKRMARRHGAVAAINGDFGTPSGRPSNTFAEDGDLKQVGFGGAPNFALATDERTAFFARPFEAVTVNEGDTWVTDRWNFGRPGATDISVFTPAGGTLEQPPANACAARLMPVSGRRWASNRSGVEVDYAVNGVSCGTGPVPVNGGVVVAAQPGSDGAILINSLTAGESIRLTWSVGWNDVLDTVGGMPLLVDGGRRVVSACSEYLCRKHPRTGIGITAAGRILMVVVDGRRRDSKGLTLVQFARVMLRLGAGRALNLDGGGSSTMVVRKRVMNQPSDGRQRAVSSAILVLPGPDAGDVVGGPVARTPISPAAPPPGRDRAGEAAVLDPASTGGMLEALARGTFGAPVELPPPLRKALREFRSSALE